MFKTYKASAGSGKTTRLVAEYLAICLVDINRYRDVLAITFTNNATAEMKERIVRTMDTFAFEPRENWNGSEKAIFQMIQELEPRLSEDQILEQSKLLLGKILYDYPNFSISTIDGFFQRILRAFAFEFGINLNYEVEITLDDYYQQTIDLLFNKLSKETPDLNRRILNIVHSKMSDNGRWHIEPELEELLDIAYTDERSAEPLQKLSLVENYEQIISELSEKQRKEASELYALAKKGDDYIKSTQLYASDFYQGTKGIYNWFEKYTPEGCSINSYIQKCLEPDGCFVKSSVPDSQTIHTNILNHFKDLYKRTCEFQKDQILLKEMKALTLLFDLKNIMNDIKERDNKFFLSETNFKIHNEIKEGDSDYLFEKIGNRYKFFFIDEFQDTSSMQWRNMIPLLHNALSSEGTKAILFGDVKQAIYRFRNGESRLFADLTAETVKPEYLNLYPGDKDGQFRQQVGLSTNYRSGEHIVQFNNQFFSTLNKLSGFPNSSKLENLFKDYFQDAQQLTAEQKRNKGLVQIRFMQEDDSWDEYSEKGVLDAVTDALNRQYRHGDIAVLTSSRQLGSSLARLLSENGHPVISSDALLLNASDKVRLVISVLQYLLSPKDLLTRLHIIHLIMRIQHIDEMDKLPNYISKIADNDQFDELLAEYKTPIPRDKWMQLPLYTLVLQILETFGITQTDAYIITLLDNILDYIPKRNNEIGPFLEWWDENANKLSLTCPHGMNAITVTTVHKSKGLQYPVVIFPYQKSASFNTRSHEWIEMAHTKDFPLPDVRVSIDAKLEKVAELTEIYEDERAMTNMDNLNKIYVAHTRPTDMLYIITGKQRQKSESTGSYHLLMDDFLHQNIKGQSVTETADGKTITTRTDGLLPGVNEMPEHPTQYWYGDFEWTNPDKDNPDSQDESANSDISQIFVSQFSPLDLVPHLDAANTVEQEIGNTIHQFLSQLAHFPLTEEEVETFTFDEHQPYQDEIRNALRVIAKDAHLHPYFADNVKALNEVSILKPESSDTPSPDGKPANSHLIYRPDRIVFLEGQTVVLDYKTGNPSDKAKRQYEEQINRYAELLRSMGYPNVHAELVYFL